MNFLVLSMEFPIKIVCHFSSKLMGIFIRLSCHILCKEVQTKLQVAKSFPRNAGTDPLEKQLDPWGPGRFVWPSVKYVDD